MNGNILNSNTLDRLLNSAETSGLFPAQALRLALVQLGRLEGSGYYPVFRAAGTAAQRWFKEGRCISAYVY